MRRFLSVLVIIVLSLACNEREPIKSKNNKSCISLNLSELEKMKNNLFLDFYSGMNEIEFQQVSVNLLNKNKLKKDSVIKYKLWIADSLNKSPFYVASVDLVLIPHYHDCRLYKIELQAIKSTSYRNSSPSNGIIFQSRLENIPSSSDIRMIQISYELKYGNPKKVNSLEGTEINEWHFATKIIQATNIDNPSNNIVKNYSINYINKEIDSLRLVAIQKNKDKSDSITNQRVIKSLDDI